jgi:hypothetical protein
MSGRASGLLPSVVLPLLFLSTGLCCDRGPCDPIPRKSEQRLTQEYFAREKVFVWQRRLKLEDWHITVLVSRASELKPDTLGNIHWDADTKSAVIRVMDAVDYKLSFDAVLKDVENTVVHELLHLELASLPHSEASRSTEERAVSRITEALLLMQQR